jgi:hypothetical protein
MRTNNIKYVAKAWVEMWSYGLESPERDKFAWVADFEYEATYENPEIGFQLVLEVIKLDPSKEIIEVLAAGPLESLLSHHGESMIRKIELEAKTNSKFTNLLGGVWQQSISDEVWKKVQNVWDRSGWDENT